ncbi:MAG: ATP-binding protein [Tannerellaceae bacterium]|jgi:energy-coupling factor transporter ATP-binding protein EcfA2|nr:ATP-binding protein [Tannerellaceae bacterium]
MNISFENLGIIKQMEVDLSKKLTIFCGQNGTGKTYACYALYGYLEGIYDLKSIFDFRDLLTKKSLQVKLDYDSLYDLACQRMTTLSNEMGVLFGVLDNQLFPNFKAHLNTERSVFIEALNGLHLSVEATTMYASVRYEKKSGDNILYIHLVRHSMKESDIDITNFFLNQHLVDILSKGGDLGQPYFFPVERSSIYTFIDSFAAIRPEDNIRLHYPVPVQRMLGEVSRLKSIKDLTSPYKFLADEIEKNVLRGEVFVSEEGEVLFRSEKCRERLFPPHLSAAIVKNLSGILIYLKHQAKQGDVLIIDEPELGLHPDNQVLLARILTKIANAGIRVVISTHSDYITQEVNNLIMLSSEKITDEVFADEDFRESGLLRSDSIKPQDVAAYIFDFDSEEPNRVSVSTAAMNVDGFQVATIEGTASRMQDYSMALYYAVWKEEEK